ncbi:o-succinylbenzoate synthase [Herbiconiux daphne]|uniref:o-succinylbenzoate synthase n=1 Tax=Herbiconiux daphne TaxID=2970914 RepID=A0ABT2H3I3_9MICO|nr:o-succinylbenzoate synthase [Herbiconiux daphne]MCS5734493.1 o-succinylbenzoate synthase [Herbiconiux daphne]
MKFTAFELRRVVLPLVSPFTTSFGTQHHREAVILRAVGADAEGWGECVALADPVYSPEYTAGAHQILRSYLLPRLLAAGDVSALQVAPLLHGIVGHRMAKSALEMAVLDAELRAADQSLARYLGATVDRVPSGVSVGIMDTLDDLVSAVGGYLEAGYQRIKIKIKPGWDIEPVRVLREAFGDGFGLQVDANTAYTLGDAAHLRRLDEFRLLLMEQPLGEEDIRQHAELARLVTTPICLDESIVSAEATADAIALRAASVINIKPGRVGGYLEARRIHDICRANGLPVWCGGMLETGLGRAANAALAALPGFTLPGDISASNRFYATDITEPIVLEDGYIRVPTGSGIGVTPIPELLDEVTTEVEWITA